VARTQNISEETAQIIDAEVRRLIDEAYTSARTILTKQKKAWIALAEGLLEYETLSGEEIKQLIAGHKPSRDLGDDTPTSRGSAVPKAGGTARGKKKGPEPEGGMEPQPQG
jgi:cell division protease FtsH